MKIRWDGHLATEVYFYVDDGRATGFCREICWAATRQVTSCCTRFGVQDKAPKRTFPGPKQGPWSGSVTHTNRGEVAGLISDEKWAKTRGLILELFTMVLEALRKERVWRNAHPCIRATRDAKGRRRYRWAPGGGEAY